MYGLAMAVRSRLKLLIAERNIALMREGKQTLTQRSIAESTGLSLSVISGLAANRTERVDFTTLNKLCAFFEVQPGDILVYSRDEFAPTAHQQS